MNSKKSHIFAALLSLLIFIPGHPRAQTVTETPDLSERKFELGGQFTYLRRKDPNIGGRALINLGFINGPEHPNNINDLGFGARFGFNLNRHIALEAETNFFPKDQTRPYIIGVPVSVVEPGGRKFLAVFGPKIGVRKDRFGIFAKVRPGFITVGRHESIITVGTPTNPFVLGDVRYNQSFFAVDVGGVFEYYPSKRTILRFDLGDTIIRYGTQEPKNLNPSFTRHNLQTSVGFGFRF
ncbi:MAG: hypothetical protein ABIP75_07310 [Pyrinomonadaceae bacterium]